MGLFSMKLIILDRDTIICQSSQTYLSSSLDEWNPVAGSLDAIARLSHAGYWVVVVIYGTGGNSISDEIEMLNRVHEKMHRLVNEAGGTIEAIFFATGAEADSTTPDSATDSSLLQEIAERLKVNLTGVPIVSGNFAYLLPARELNMMPILIDSRKKNATAVTAEGTQLLFSNLVTVTDYLLSKVD